jgi:hypothetical protein
MFCNAFDDMASFSYHNTMGVTLTHLFRKEEGWATPWLPSLGQAVVPVELQSGRFK